MLDVLITQSLDTPTEWVEQCIESVHKAAANAPFLVRAIIVQGVPGHIGAAMASGLALSTAKYVCWVDDDDYVLPKAFACITEPLHAGAPAVCTREVELYANGYSEKCHARHHLTVYNALWAKQQDLMPFRATPNVALLKRLPADTVDVLEWTYVRRHRLSPGMGLRGLYQQQEAPLWQAS